MSKFSDMIAGIKMGRAEVQKKIAEIAGQDPDSMPGAENDKPVTVPNEDPEVNDGSMGPKSSRSTEGAGDDRKITAGDLFEAGEPVVTPEKKPLETADANAKEASAKNYANEILELIHGTQKKASAPEKAPANEAAAPEKKPEAPAKEAAAPEKKPEAPAKTDEAKEASLNLELTRDVLDKIACAMLADKEGVELAERVLAKQAGAEKAAEVMDYLAGQEQAAREYVAGQKAAEYMLYKRAQDLGAADADAAIAAMAAQAPEAAPADVPPPAPEAAPADVPPVDDEMLPEDAVAQVLLSQLESGNLTEQDLGEIVAELAAEEPEVAKELGIDLGVDEGATAAPSAEGASEAAPDDAEKAASVKKASAPKILKQAALVSKVAQAAKLLTVHLKK